MNQQALWYASRASGAVLLVVLSLVAVIGITTHQRSHAVGLPRFAMTALHRNLSLLAIALLSVHVVTAVVDSYVSIGWVAAVVPFTSAYQPFRVGLGAVALELCIALVVTSLLRRRLGWRTWRITHWAAYLAWPVALAHGVSSSPDLQSGALLLVTLAGAVSVTMAVLWRVLTARRMTSSDQIGENLWRDVRFREPVIVGDRSPR